MAAKEEVRRMELEFVNIQGELERVNRQNSELLAALSAAKATPRARGKS